MSCLSVPTLPKASNIHDGLHPFMNETNNLTLDYVEANYISCSLVELEASVMKPASRWSGGSKGGHLAPYSSRASRRVVTLSIHIHDRFFRFALAAIACGLASAPCEAWAQTNFGDVSVQRFEPAIGPRNFSSVAGARTDGHWAWSAGLVFDYARKPFVLRSCATATDCTAGSGEDLSIVEDMFTWSVLASLTPTPRFQIGLRVPVVLARGREIPATPVNSSTTTSADANPIDTAAAAGDMAVEAQVRIFGAPHDTVTLAAVAHIAAPLGHLSAQGKFIGNEPPVSAGFGGIVDIRHGRFAAAVNLRGLYRTTVDLGVGTAGSEFRWGAATSFDATYRFAIYAEGLGATRFDANSASNPLEVGGGGRFRATPELTIGLGGHAGVLQGIGVPVARGVLSIQYATSGVDNDEKKKKKKKKTARLSLPAD